MTRTKSRKRTGKAMATPGTLYWLKPSRRQIYPAAPPCDTACPAMLDFVVYLVYRAGLAIAAGLPLPASLWPLGSSLVFVHGSFPGNIDAWQSATSPLRLPMKRPARNRVGSSAAISNDSALTSSCSVKLTAMPPGENPAAGRG